MAKFPLPGDTFPPLDLTEDDEDALRDLADSFIRNATKEFAAFRSGDCRVDTSRWKLVKRRDQLTAYQDRVLRDRRTLTHRNRNRYNDAQVGTMTFSTQLHGVLTVGSLDGQLEDMMYGLLHPTTDQLRVKSRYTEDKVVDAKVLAPIIEPSLVEPMRAMYLKWSVSDYAPPFLRRFVRPRDFVYIESVGFLDDDGEEGGCRIGFNLLHSIQVPGIRELTDHGIVRANFSICALFRQSRVGKVEVFMKGFVDSMGDITQAVAVPATAEAMLSFRKALYTAEMKKLAWLLRVHTGHYNVERRIPSMCAFCKRSMGHGRRPARHQCAMCRVYLCSYCCVPRQLFFLSRRRDQVVGRRLEFCPRCIDDASKLDAVNVAQQELEAASVFVKGFITGSAATTSLEHSPTESLDGHREFFG